MNLLIRGFCQKVAIVCTFLFLFFHQTNVVYTLLPFLFFLPASASLDLLHIAHGVVCSFHSWMADHYADALRDIYTVSCEWYFEFFFFPLYVMQFGESEPTAQRKIQSRKAQIQNSGLFIDPCIGQLLLGIGN